MRAIGLTADGNRRLIPLGLSDRLPRSIAIFMTEDTRPVPQLTCRHLTLTQAQLLRLKHARQLAETNSAKPPRSLRDFQRQYARVHEQQRGTTPN